MALVDMVPLLGKEQKYFILFAYSYQLIGIIIFYVNHNQLYSRDLITWIIQNTLFHDYYTMVQNYLVPLRSRGLNGKL